MVLEVQESNKKCEYCNSLGWFSCKYNKVLCSKHYAQLKNIGRICNTKYDINEIIEYKDYIAIITKNSKYEITGEFIIDKEDYEKVKNIRWRNHKGYAINNSRKNNQILYLHRIIMDTPDDIVCDHINRNTFDCRKINLRNIYQHENSINVKRRTSKIAGVSKHRNKWRSRITLNGHEHHLGIYDKYIDAVQKRLQAEALYFGVLSPNYNTKTNRLEIQFYDENTEKYYKVNCCLPNPIYNVEIIESTLEEIR